MLFNLQNVLIISILKVYSTISMTLFYTIKCILCKKTFYLEILTLYKVVCINIYIIKSIFFSMFTINILDTIKHHEQKTFKT